MWQDSDWEEAQAGDAEADQDLLYSVGDTSYSRPSYEYLDAMAKAIDEVCHNMTFFRLLILLVPKVCLLCHLDAYCVIWILSF